MKQGFYGAMRSSKSFRNRVKLIVSNKFRYGDVPRAKIFLQVSMKVTGVYENLQVK